MHTDVNQDVTLELEHRYHSLTVMALSGLLAMVMAEAIEVSFSNGQHRGGGTDQ